MIKVRPYCIVRPKAFLFTAECALLPIIVLTAWAVSGISRPPSVSGSVGLLLALIACQLCFGFSGLHRLIVTSTFLPFLSRTFKAFLAALVFTGVFFQLFPSLSPGFLMIFATAILCGALAVTLRPVLFALIRRKTLVEDLLIVGTDEGATEFCRELAKAATARDIRTVVASGAGGSAQGELTLDHQGLKKLAIREGVSKIVVAQLDGPDRQQLVNSLIECKLRGVAVEDAVGFYERLTGKIWIKAMQPEWFVYADGFHFSKCFPFVKRLMDITCALALILVTAPVALLVAVCVKIDSPGPILFKQQRIGLHGQPFTLMKFRSMRHGAERTTGPVWAIDGDLRMTAFGRFLRHYRLDELPQVVNVLRGEMSFIGPRPERPYFVDMLREQVRYYDLRHFVKPGISGWAQVIYPYGASIEDAVEKLQYDLYYIKHMSFRLDLLALLKTFNVVLFGRGR